jgi:hypothetical protein
VVFSALFKSHHLGAPFSACKGYSSMEDVYIHLFSACQKHNLKRFLWPSRAKKKLSRLSDVHSDLERDDIILQNSALTMLEENIFFLRALVRALSSDL